MTLPLPPSDPPIDGGDAGAGEQGDGIHGTARHPHPHQPRPIAQLCGYVGALRRTHRPAEGTLRYDLLRSALQD